MNRKVKILYEDQLGFFKITSEDGVNVLSGWQAHVINQNGWFAAEDGHRGLHAIVCAPKDKHEFLENLFTNPTFINTLIH